MSEDWATAAVRAVLDAGVPLEGGGFLVERDTAALAEDVRMVEQVRAQPQAIAVQEIADEWLRVRGEPMRDLEDRSPRLYHALDRLVEEVTRDE